MKRERRRERLAPVKEPDLAYVRLWRVVDGAVLDALKAHPDYLAPKGALFNNARRSIVKRVVGAVQGFDAQAPKGRTGSSRQAENVSAVNSSEAALGPVSG